MEQPIPQDCELMLGELIGRWPATIPVFLAHKMLCVGCLVNPFHTIADACAEYGLKTCEFVAELNAAIADSSDAATQVSGKKHDSSQLSIFGAVFGKPY